MQLGELSNSLGTTQILTARGPRNSVDPRRPYAFLVESEHAASGRVEDVATIFLTNRECPFRCLMCDLWKNTTEQRVPVGAIPEQIDYALSRLPPAKHIKLYNSGNFFDRQAIPPEDYEAIADRVRGFETVIVENHPRLLGDDCLRFRDLIAGELEVAIGLETAHPQVLQRLNKQMTLEDFEQAVRRLSTNGIATSRVPPAAPAIPQRGGRCSLGDSFDGVRVRCWGRLLFGHTDSRREWDYGTIETSRSVHSPEYAFLGDGLGSGLGDAAGTRLRGPVGCRDVL